MISVGGYRGAKLFDKLEMFFHIKMALAVCCDITVHSQKTEGTRAAKKKEKGKKFSNEGNK
jgi:hypothetical protein